MSALRAAVAGAARALWLSDIGPSLSLQTLLKTEPGARIVWKQARMTIGEPVTLMGFAMLSTQRRAVADAAQLLVVSRGATSGWLYGARPGQIVDCANHAHEADRNIGGFTERHGSRVIAAPGSDPVRDSSVADAAQWLHMNRERVGPRWLRENDAQTILRVRALAQSYSERIEDKKYSLSDLRRAYDMGFGASGEGWNQEIHPDYAEQEDYQSARLEALREFK